MSSRFKLTEPKLSSILDRLLPRKIHARQLLCVSEDAVWQWLRKGECPAGPVSIVLSALGKEDQPQYHARRIACTVRELSVESSESAFWLRMVIKETGLQIPQFAALIQRGTVAVYEWLKQGIVPSTTSMLLVMIDEGMILPEDLEDPRCLLEPNQC